MRVQLRSSRMALQQGCMTRSIASFGSIMRSGTVSSTTHTSTFSINKTIAPAACWRRVVVCIGKSALLAATARVIGVPARVGYADVRNHMTSRRLRERTKSDIFIWHSYTDLYIDGRWVKATPVFDQALCERVGLKPLEFDGRQDSLFHPFDREGRRHMEYLRDRGTFPDVPFETIQADFRLAYPSLVSERCLKGDFHAEAMVPKTSKQRASF